MARIFFRNVTIFDGSGKAPYPGEVLVDGHRIKAVAAGAGAIPADGAETIDGGGATLMPGLIEPHAHLTFPCAVDRIDMRWGMRPPPERHAFFTAHNAKVLLDYGFTAAYSGGATNPAIEVQLRDDINAGFLPGPRLKASSFERTVEGNRLTGGEGVEQIRQFARDMIALGVDNMKLILSARSNILPQHFNDLYYGDAELAALSEMASEAGIDLTGHAYSPESIRLALRYGFRAIYHCNFADEATLDLMEAKKDEIFVSPAVGIICADRASVGHAPPDSPTSQPGAKEGIEQIWHAQREVVPKMHKRGIRVLPGGDYGFPHNPVGKNAWDAELFVTDFGFTAEETLKAMTLFGAQLLDMEGELGQVREGFLADLIMVDGDPTKNIGILQDIAKITMVMKGGAFHRRPSATAVPAQAAAE